MQKKTAHPKKGENQALRRPPPPAETQPCARCCDIPEAVPAREQPEWPYLLGRPAPRPAADWSCSALGWELLRASQVDRGSQLLPAFRLVGRQLDVWAGQCRAEGRGAPSSETREAAALPWAVVLSWVRWEHAVSRGRLWPQEVEDCSCWSSGLHYLEAGSKTGMGTIPSDSALGAEPAVAVHPEEEEESESRAAPSLGNFQQDLLEEEWTGPLLIEEEEEEDGGEGEGVRTGPTVDDQSGPPEEEPSGALTTWHPKGGLGELCVDAGDSPAPGRPPPVTEEARDEAGSAAPAGEEEEEEEGSQAGSRRELPLVEEVGRMEQVSLLGSKAHRAPAQSCCIQVEAAAGEEQECPICTEVYDQDHRKPALLNCNHVLCGRCLRAILEAGSAADIGRVRCPICRQKTPMMEWEICKLQEELLLLSSAQGPALGPPAFGPLPPRQPGFWGALEHRFQVRFHTSRVMGFFPCLRYPACLIGGLARLERRCRGGYRAALLALAAAETLSLLLVFLPIFLLLLLFLILDK